MKIVIEFFTAYWKEILYGFASFISLMCLVFKKCKVKVIDSAYELALQKLPRWILIAENFFSNGTSKKEYVLTEALKFICEVSHRGYKEVSNEYETRLSNALENILSTPTKKGEKCETTNEKIQRP